MRRKLIALISASMMSVLGLSMIAPVAVADERSDLVDQQEEQQKEIERLQSELEGVDVQLQKAYLDLEETRGKIPQAEAQLATAENELSAAEREAEANTALLDAAKAELTTIADEIETSKTAAAESRGNLGSLARATYRGETTPSTISLIMGSTSAEDFLDSYRISTAVARSQDSALVELEQQTASAENRQARQTAVEDEVTRLKAEADALVVVKEEKRQAAEIRKTELLDLEKQFENQSKTLEEQKAQHASSIDAAQAAKDDTAQRIKAIDEENRRKAAEEKRRREEEAARQAEIERQAEAERQAQAQRQQQSQQQAKPKSNTGSSNSGSSNSGSSRSGSGSSSSISRSVSGSWIQPPVPAPVYVTSPFGMRVYPMDGRRWMHNGVDLRSRCGDPQYAAADGTIASVRPAAGNGTHGNQIYVNHGIVNGSSYVSVTNHLSAFNVRAGQSVKKGDVIGWTGQTGQVTGCHVHFEVWKNGSVIDPMQFSSFARRY